MNTYETNEKKKETFSKEIEDIRENEIEIMQQKNIITEIQSLVYGSNNRMGRKEERNQ